MTEETEKISSSPSEKTQGLASPDQMVLTGSMVGMRNSYPDAGQSSFLGNTPTANSRLLRYHEFQCPLCPRSYAQKCSLYRHMKVHKDDHIDTKDIEETPTSDGKYKCPFCIAAYSNSASLNVHVRTHAVGYRDMVKKPVSQVAKEEESIFPCTLCNRVFQRRSRLTVHLNISHKNENYGDILNGDVDHGSDLEAELNDEDEELENNGSLKKKFSSGAGAFQCHICGSSYTRRTNLNKHLEKRHNFFSEPVPMDLSVGKDEGPPVHPEPDEVPEEHKCPFCTFKTAQRYSLYRHMTSTHADQKNLQEEMVKQVLGENKKRMTATEERKDDDDQDDGKEEIFPCQFCSRVYMRKCNLTQHLKMHYDGEIETPGGLAVKDRMAQFCNEVESEVEEVRRIIQLTKMNQDDQKDVHECAICGLTFGVKGSLILHLKMHERRALAKNQKNEGTTSKSDHGSKKSTPSSSKESLPGMPPQLIPVPGGTPLISPNGAMVSPQGLVDPSMFVMTQDKDGHTTIHNQQQYMLSHLQILNQVRNMIMFGRETMPPGSVMDGQPSPNLTPAHMTIQPPRKRSFPSDESGTSKRARPGPKPGRHWKSLECDPNRRPVRKCSLCPFEIAEGNREGLLQHMASVHGVSCKLCPNVKFFSKQDFDQHCNIMHQYVLHANEMEQLMVFGEISEATKFENSGEKSADVQGENESPGKSALSSGLGSPMALPSPGLLTAAAVMNPMLQNEAFKIMPTLPYAPNQDSSPNLELNNSGQSRQTCPKCGLNYAQKSSLNRHIRSHHNYSRVEELIKAEKMAGNPLFGEYEEEEETSSTKSSDLPPPLIPMAPFHGMAKVPMNLATSPRLYTDILPQKATPIFNNDEPMDLGKPGQVSYSEPQNEAHDLSMASNQTYSKVDSIETSFGKLQNQPEDHHGLKYSIMGPRTSTFVAQRGLSVPLVSPESDDELGSFTNSVTESPSSSIEMSTKARSRRKPQVVKRVVRSFNADDEEESKSSKHSTWNSAVDDDDDIGEDWGGNPNEWNEQFSLSHTRKSGSDDALVALQRFCDVEKSSSVADKSPFSAEASVEDSSDEFVMDLSNKKKESEHELIRNDEDLSDDEVVELESGSGDISEIPQANEEMAHMQDCYASDLADTDENLSEGEFYDEESNLETEITENSMTDNNGNKVEKTCHQGSLPVTSVSVAV